MTQHIVLFKFKPGVSWADDAVLAARRTWRAGSARALSTWRGAGHSKPSAEVALAHRRYWLCDRRRA